MPISGLLALVQPDLPRSPLGLRALKNSEPELAKEFERLWRLCEKLDRLGGEDSKGAFVQSLLGAASDENPYDAFSRRIQAVRDMQRSLAKRYMPDDLAARVMPQSNLDTDPVELLFVGFSEISKRGRVPEDAQNNASEERRAFEARRDLRLALLDWELRQTKRIGRGYTEGDRLLFLNALITQGILCGMPQQSDIQSLHDPHNAMHTVWVSYFNGEKPNDPEKRLVERQIKLYLGEIRLSGDRIIPDAVEFRRKGLLAIIGKMLTVEGATGVQDVEDRRGLRFVYASLQDMQKGAAFIRDQLPLTDSMSGKENYRDTTSGDVHLPFIGSHSRIPMISFFRSIAGHRVQLQNFVARDHLDMIYARDSKNHAMYKLRKYVAPKSPKALGLLFWLFPAAIYGVQWNDEKVLERLYNHVLASLST